MSIAEHILHVTRVGGTGTAIDFGGAQLSWIALRSGVAEIDRLLSGAGIGVDSVIGLLGRNRLEQLGGFIGVIGSGRALLLINAQRPGALVVEEVAGLSLACIIGDRLDLTPDIIAAAASRGTMVLAADASDGSLRFETLLERGGGPFRARSPGTLIEIQTSGTTGAPKRIPVSEHTVEASLRDGVRTAKGAVAQAQLAPKSSPTLMFGPLVHTSGTFNTLMSVFEVRPIVLFEKFDAVLYRDALRRYRPKFAALPPTALKMLLDSDASAEDFASVVSVRAGTAPLPIELHKAFETKFNVPVLTTYGATEFMGVVTSWTLEDYRRYGASKPGSVGRVSKGVRIRVVDPETRAELGPDEAGILEAQLDRIDGGAAWIRTTDLARIDAEGFLTILGRADDAIMRGGFKVMAGKVADVLRTCPGVADAFVIGQPDERLGEVPVAVVEPDPSAAPIAQEALKAYARERLTAYEVPARFHVVDRLPRTISDKVSRPEVKRLLAAIEDRPEAGA